MCVCTCFLKSNLKISHLQVLKTTICILMLPNSECAKRWLKWKFNNNVLEKNAKTMLKMLKNLP